MENLIVVKKAESMMVDFSTRDIQLATLSASLKFIGRKAQIGEWQLLIQNQTFNLNNPIIPVDEYAKLINAVYIFCEELKTAYSTEVQAFASLEIDN